MQYQLDWVRDSLRFILTRRAFYMIVVLLGILFYLNGQQYHGTIVSRGLEGARINMRSQMLQYKAFERTYRDKTDKVITPNYLASREIVKDGLNNGKEFDNLTGSQVYARMLYKPYTIEGKVVVKIRMDEGPDYLELSDNGSTYAVFFKDALPPQVTGDYISVTGIVVGRMTAREPKTAIVSTYRDVTTWHPNSEVKKPTVDY